MPVIFQKSRFEQKRYAEIAEEMNLSIKTVEAQMESIEDIEEQLKEYT